jgi:D(-)-tartrate dehydratase
VVVSQTFWYAGRDHWKVEKGYIVMPELPGIGFEGTADLIRVMRRRAE